ncbi:MAG: ribonuclease HII [Eubacteriaceae bacterium]|nr:ribonuclease HII [Eubacteriaceae bacterium]
MKLNDIDISKLNIKEITALEKEVSGEELETLARFLQEDSRAGVRKRAAGVMKRYEKYRLEEARLDAVKMREDYHHKNGIIHIAGIDEVGRGPLFGPVVAAAVIMPEDSRIPYVNDSKQLSAAKREELYDIIMNEAVSVGIGIVDNNVIDEINILNATKLAMKTAVDNLSVRPELLILDAVDIECDIPQESVIKGDANVYCIAAASIVAKVVRDRMLDEYSKIYPHYGLEKNKGYGTQEHLDGINKFGATPLHRKTFISKMDFTSDSLGRRCEEFVKNYLTTTLGYVLLEQRFRSDGGEIDLIMQDKDEIVFVEVKGRDLKGAYDGEDAVTQSKKRRIIHAAEMYLNGREVPARFDIIAVKYNAEEGKIKNLRHYKNAFYKGDVFNTGK